MKLLGVVFKQSPNNKKLKTEMGGGGRGVENKQIRFCTKKKKKICTSCEIVKKKKKVKILFGGEVFAISLKNDKD